MLNELLSMVPDTKVTEAYRGKDLKKVMSNIISYIEKKTGKILIKIPGMDVFQNSKEHGAGVRYVFNGTKVMIRFNWSNKAEIGKSNELMSIDVWTGLTGADPTFNISTKGVSLVKALPQFADKLLTLKRGNTKVEMVDEGFLTEARSGEYSYDLAIRDMAHKMVFDNMTFSRTEFVGRYHISNVQAFELFKEAFPQYINVSNAGRVSLDKSIDKKQFIKDVFAKSFDEEDESDGELVISAGGRDESYTPSKEESEVDSQAHISYEEVLSHLKALTLMLTRNALNALIVAGKSGVSKTETVERTLQEEGLEPDAGYIRVAGSISAWGMYELLYKNRTSIILFDDCDDAFKTQEGRNILKNATDSRKNRQISWNKDNPKLFNPDEEDEGMDEFDDGDGDDIKSVIKKSKKIPNKFTFTGRVIFISNLQPEKLDPDGALRGRSALININPTNEEIIEKMGKILFDVRLEDGLTITKEERLAVYEKLKQSKKKNVTLRTLVKALSAAAAKIGNWEQLVNLYF